MTALIRAVFFRHFSIIFQQDISRLTDTPPPHPHPERVLRVKVVTELAQHAASAENKLWQENRRAATGVIKNQEI